MYTIYLCGGLGNNMFQLCLGEFLMSQGIKVTYNDTLTKKNYLTKRLGWTIHKNDLINKLLEGKDIGTSLGVVDCLFLLREYFFNKLLNRNSYIYIHKKNYQKNTRLWNYAAIGVHMNKANIQLFKEYCSKRVDELRVLTNQSNYAVVHVRKGDFLSHSRLNNSYYKEALKYVAKDINIYLVSDCPELLPKLEEEYGRSLYLKDGNSMTEDFVTIINASIIISSNSTFCFWASVLSDAELIIHPERISEYKSYFLPFIDRNSKVISCTFESELDET
jgi:hypothetical protein